MKSCTVALALIFCLLFANTIAQTTTTSGSTSAAASSSSSAVAGSTSSTAAASSSSTAAAAGTTTSTGAAASTTTAKATSTGAAASTSAAGTSAAGTTTGNNTGPISIIQYSAVVTLDITLGGNATLNSTDLANIGSIILSTIANQTVGNFSALNITVTVTQVNTALLNSALALRFKKAFQAVDATNGTSHLRVVINFPSNASLAALSGGGNGSNLNVNASLATIQSALISIANSSLIVAKLASLNLTITGITATAVATRSIVFVTGGTSSTTVGAISSTSTTTGDGSFLAPKGWLLAFGFVSTFFALIL